MEFNVFKLDYQNGSNGLVFVDRVPFKSVVWEEKFNTVGKMQAVFPKSRDALSIIKVGRFAAITPDYHEFNISIMYIQSVKVTETEVWAYGAEAKVLWQKAAMMNLGDNFGTVTVKDRLEDAITTYGAFSFLDTSAIYIPNLGTGNFDALEFKSVYDFVTSVLSAYSAGWRVAYDPQGDKLSIWARQGIDKSDTVRFATFLGNTIKSEYTVDNQSYYNRVYCVGLDGDSVVIEYVDKANSDHEIYAAYLDVRTEFPRPEDMSLTDYKTALHDRANMSVIARHAQESLKILDADNSGFGSEYTLGDIVGVVIDDIGITAKRRVSGVKRVLEGNLDKLTIELSAI